MATVASNPVPVSIMASAASIPAPTLNATPSVATAATTVDLTQVGSFSQDHLGQSTFSTVSPAAVDLQSIVSVDDIDSLLSMNWNLPDIDLAPKSLSEPGYPTSHRAHGGTSDQSCRNPMPGMLPLRSTSTSLMDPNLVLRALEPLKVGYDNVGRVGVALARFSFFGDDVLQVSTLKGKGSKPALNAHKLEALYSFMHNREPFCHFSRKEFDSLIKGKIEGALKDHLKSPSNRSPVVK